jgi:pilus assembly protein Flp/PilA
MRVRSLLADDDGVTLVEYALLLALIAVVSIVAITLVGHNASTLLSSVAKSL